MLRSVHLPQLMFTRFLAASLALLLVSAIAFPWLERPLREKLRGKKKTGA